MNLRKGVLADVGVVKSIVCRFIAGLAFLSKIMYCRESTMKILVSDIVEEGIDVEFEETIDRDELRLLLPVKASLHIERVKDEVLVRGSLSTSLEMECSRCLKDFAEERNVAMNVVFHSLEELKGEEKHEIKRDELDMGFYRGDMLDLRDLLEEQILLTIPMKPLCSEGCRGICPQCGADLNTGSCTCGEKRTDQRLDLLKKLLVDRKE